MIVSEKPLEIEGVQVQVDWGKFYVGSSFFVPCIQPQSFLISFLVHARRREFTVYSMKRVENGMWGIRIWRTA